MKNQVEKVKAAGHELVSVYWDYCSAFLQSGEYLRSTGQYIYIYEMSFARFKSNGLKANKYCIYGVQISVTKTSLSLGHLTSISSNAAVLSHINVFCPAWLCRSLEFYSRVILLGHRAFISFGRLARLSSYFKLVGFRGEFSKDAGWWYSKLRSAWWAH